MRIAFHIGAHCTDEDQLIASLGKNRPVLEGRGIIVARPHQFRPATRDVMLQLRGAEADVATQEALLTKILGQAHAERLVLSFQSFICGPAKVLEDGELYGKAGFKARWLRNMFPDHACELFMGIRNPATFLPALMALQPDGTSLPFFMNGAEPQDLRWSDVVRRIQEENPGCPLTVWCNEDTPLIWGTVLREIADLDQLVSLDGEFDVIESIMKPDGFQRMKNYLKSRPPHSEIQRRRVLAAFLDKFAIEDAVEEELDLPGWTPELVYDLTQRYEEDVYEIERMPGVTLLTT